MLYKRSTLEFLPDVNFLLIGEEDTGAIRPMGRVFLSINCCGSCPQLCGKIKVSLLLDTFMMSRTDQVRLLADNRFLELRRGSGPIFVEQMCILPRFFHTAVSRNPIMGWINRCCKCQRRFGLPHLPSMCDPIHRSLTQGVTRPWR